MVLSTDTGRETVSVKKLKKGDGTWDTRKVILGWLIDTLRGTIELPNHKKERLLAIFDDLRGRKRISVKEWQKILGELRHII